MDGDSFRRLQGKVNGWYISSTPWDQNTGRVSAIYKKYNACIDLYDNVVNAEAFVHPEGTSIGSDNCDLSKVPDPHSKQWRIVLIASF